MVVTIVGESLADARRGCGCPATVVDVAADEHDHAQRGAVDRAVAEQVREQAAFADGGVQE